MTIVKICGLKDAESAQVALEAGADLLGFIMVPNRARTIDPQVAKDIAQLCKERQNITNKELYEQLDFNNWTSSAHDLIKEHGPYSVGVFRNQSVQEINDAVERVGFDFVQLHGAEPRDEYINKITVPVITRFVPGDKEIHKVNHQSQLLTLFDSEAGGEGEVLNWEALNQWGESSGATYVLAGGLTPKNVSDAARIRGVIGVDVSTGVETDGVKDHQKIKDFVRNAQ
jgi:phosphoribosylanthranilate isomerase